MKFLFFFLTTLIIPFFLHSLNEQECKSYYESSLSNIKKAQEQINKISPHTSIEDKIVLIDSALYSCHLAIVDLDVILNDIHSKKPHKIKPWQNEIKAAAKKLKEECFQFSDNLHKNLKPLKLMASFESKLKEYNKRTGVLSGKILKVSSVTGLSTVNVLDDTITEFSFAISPLQEILSEMAPIENSDLFESFKNLKKQIVSEVSRQLSALEEFKTKRKEFQDQAEVLQEHLLILEKIESNLVTKKKIEAILKELSGLSAVYLNQLGMVRSQISALEGAEKAKNKKKESSIIDQNFCEKEEIAKHQFFKTQGCDVLNRCNKSYLKEGDTGVIGLDAQFQSGKNEFLLYLDQFYHFYVQDQCLNFLEIDVFKDGEIVHTEYIDLPHPAHTVWYDFSAEKSFVLTSEALLNQFNIELQLLPIFVDNEKYALVVKHKASNDRFSLSFSSNNCCLYTCRFMPAPPWQLDVLRKPDLHSIEKPLEKLDANIFHEINLGFVQESPEWTSHPILDHFVEELKRDPLSIAQYVQNEIEFVDPFCLNKDSLFIPAPIQKSTLNTFLKKQGSAWEQCALLVHLLKRAGYQALYAQGCIQTLRAGDAEKLLSQQFLEKEVNFHYPWVLFFDGNKWITLFPWLKDLTFSEGYNLYDLLPEEYASGEKWIKRYLTNDLKILELIGRDEDDTAGTLFVRFVEEELKKQGLSLKDVGFQKCIKKKQFSCWHDFPRFEVNGSFNVASHLGSFPGLFTKVQIEISSLENPNKSICSNLEYLSSLVNFPTIHFEEINPSKQILEFAINKNIQKLDLNLSDHSCQIKITYHCLDNTFSQRFILSKGTCAAICFNSGGSSTKATSFFADQFETSTGKTQKLHALLSFVGALYFEKCSHSEYSLSNLHKLTPSTFLNFGLAKFTPETFEGKQHLTLPQLDMFQFQWKKETKYPFSYHQDLKLAKRDLSALLAAVFSSNEHRVLKEIFNDPYAVSTVRLLQIAHENHQNQGGCGTGFLIFTPQNLCEAEKCPILAQCLYFNHIEGINLSKLKSQSVGQWETMKTCLLCKENPWDQSFSYAYMTPGPISSKEGISLQPPSYTGIGTMIVHNNGSFSLISDGSTVMNGGYGSRLPVNTLQSIENDGWKITRTNQRFSLIPPGFSFNQSKERSSSISPGNSFQSSLNSEVISQVSSQASAQEEFKSSNPSFSEPIRSSFSVEQLKADFKNKEFVHLDNPFVRSAPIRIRSDIRIEHKSIYDTVADPVDIVTGAFYIDETDIYLPGPFPLEIRRNYNNQTPVDGLLGIGWKMSLNPQLFEQEEHLFAAEFDGTLVDYRFNPEHNRWEVFQEDNPGLSNDNKKGIGGVASPYHSYFEKRNEDYILHGSDGSTRYFKNNLLKEWVNSTGHSIHFIYDSERLKRIESATGSYLGFCYNHEGKICEVYTIDGRRVYYTYDSEGNLVKVELPDGGKIIYEYDAAHQIVKEVDPCGKILENFYDTEGKVIEQRSPSGFKAQMVTTALFTYEDNIHTATDATGGCSKYKIFQNQIFKIIDPEGHETLQSRFIDAHTWFDAETEEIKPYEGKGGYPRSLRSLKDKRGLITEYFYDEKGNPLTVTLKGADLTGYGDQVVSRHFVYNERNLCVTESFLNKRSVTTYDQDYPFLPKRIESFVSDQLISYADSQYSSNGQLIKEDHDGAVTLWEYNASGFPIKKTQKTGTIDPDVITLFRYNTQGQCIEQTTSDAVIKTDYDIVGNPFVSSIYDFSGNLLSSSCAGFGFNYMLLWKMGSDSKDISYIDYNLSGLPKASRHSLLKAVFNEEGGVVLVNAGTAYTLYDYDAAGRLTCVVDPLGRSTYKEYDLLGRVTTVKKLNETIKFSYESGGLISEMESVSGLKTTRNYSTNGLLLQEICSDSTESSFKYDLQGRLIFERKNEIVIITEYDDVLRRIIKKLHEGKGGDKGKIVSIEEFDSKGNIVLKTDAEGNQWQMRYDSLGRIIEETTPAKELTTWGYIGDRVITVYPSREKRVQKYQAGKLIEDKIYSPEGHIISQTCYESSPFSHTEKEFKGNFVSTVWINTQGKEVAKQQGDLATIYEYDACGNCTSLKDSEGNKEIYGYDESDRLIQRVLTNGTILSYGYDSQSNLISCKLPGNIEWKAAYDSSSNRLSEELESEGLFSHKWTYLYEQGRLKAATDPNFLTRTYEYDAFGRLIQELAGHYTRKFEYNLQGLITSIEQQGDETTRIERDYDYLGRITSENIFLNSCLLSHINQSWKSGKRSLQVEGHERHYHYHAGRLSEIVSEGVHLRYEHDPAGLLVKSSVNDIDISCRYHPSLLPETISLKIKDKEYEQSMSWNQMGKIIFLQSNLNGKETNNLFAYNLDGRLKAVNEDSFIFDFQKQGRGILTAAPSWEVTSSGLDSFGKIIQEISQGKQIDTCYDLLGQVVLRQTEDKKQQFKWDLFGNLVEVVSENDTWKASYDPLGRRIQTKYLKGDYEEIMTSFYDPESEFDEIGVKYGGTTFWKFGNAKCEAVSELQGDVVSLIYDALDHLAAIIDAEEIHWSEGLASPYGPRGPPASIKSSLLSFAKAHSWHSRRVDPTGYIWMGARYYDPIGARFLSPDPIGIPISLDLYSYANGDPINFFDPDGRFASAVYDSVTSFNNFMQVPGKIVSTISHHLVPIPGVKDVLEFSGWCLQGKHPAAYDWNKNRSQLIVYPGILSEQPNVRHCLYNGILVTEDEFRDRMADYSNNNNNVTVYGIYNGTHGFVLDLVEVACQKAGISVHAQEVAERETRKIINGMGDYRHMGILVVEAHSQGAETVHNLSSGVRQRMLVTALAPARILQNNEFQIAENYIGACDLVPLCDPIGLIRGIKNGNVHYIPSTRCPIVDHFYENKGFQEIRRVNGQIFSNCQGVL